MEIRWDIAAESWVEILIHFTISVHEICLMNIDSSRWINPPEGGDTFQRGQVVFVIIKGPSRDLKAGYGGGQTVLIRICE